jgi:hypothetical protein
MGLSLGAKFSSEDTQCIEIELVPSDLDDMERQGDIQRSIVDAARTIRQVISAAIQGDNPFSLRSSSIELTFAVNDEGRIALGFGGQLRDEVKHQLRLELGTVDAQPVPPARTAVDLA